MVNRLEKCVSADHVCAEIAELNAIQDEVTLVMEFLQCMKGGAGLDITQTMACIEQMQRKYKLGSTYILRIFEVNVQNSLVYQDVEKACGYMTSGSEEAKALAETLSPDQISAFVQNVMDNIVIDLLKDTKVTRNGVTVVKDSSRQQLQELHDAVSGREGFLVPSLEGILETSLAIVNCRSATATALDHAVASVEAYGEVPLDEKGPSQSFILQFFVTKGAGENLFTIARGHLAERQDEMINESLVMENINNSRAFKDKCNEHIINERHLEWLVKHVDGTTAILTRTKQQKPLNKRQRDCVEEEFEQLQTFVTFKVKDMFKQRVHASLKLSLAALETIRRRSPTGAKKVKRARSLTRMQGSWG